jgi:hypothetical protein
LRPKEELEGSQEILDERLRVVDAAKTTALQVSRVLDQALKEIAAWVSGREVVHGTEFGPILER